MMQATESANWNDVDYGVGKLVMLVLSVCGRLIGVGDNLDGD